MINIYSIYLWDGYTTHFLGACTNKQEAVDLAASYELPPRGSITVEERSEFGDPAITVVYKRLYKND